MRKLDTSRYRDRLDILAHELAEVLEFDDAKRVIGGIKQVLHDSRIEAPRNQFHIAMREEGRALLHEAEIVAGDFLLYMRMGVSRTCSAHRPMGQVRMGDIMRSPWKSRNPAYRWIRLAQEREEWSPQVQRAMGRCRR